MGLVTALPAGKHLLPRTPSVRGPVVGSWGLSAEQDGQAHPDLGFYREDRLEVTSSPISNLTIVTSLYERYK